MELEQKQQKQERLTQDEMMRAELNQAHLQSADLKSKLVKRTEELNLMKETLNRQIQEVHGVFEKENANQIQTIQNQKEQLNTKEAQISQIQA